MLVGSLAAVVPSFDVLLGVVPRAACICHHDGKKEAGSNGANQQTSKRLRAENRPNRRRRDNGDQPRQHHLAHGPPRADIDSARVIGLRLSFHESRNLAELPSDLLHHRPSGAPDRLHRQRGEQERHDASKQDAYENVHVREIEDSHARHFRIRRHEGERRQNRGADCEPLPRRRSGIAERVERVRPFSHLRRKSGLLCDPPRVVGDGSVRVGRQGDAKRRQHSDRCQGNPVGAGEVVGEPHGNDHHNAGYYRAQHTQSQPADDDGRRSSLGLRGDLTSKPILV